MAKDHDELPSIADFVPITATVRRLKRIGPPRKMDLKVRLQRCGDARGSEKIWISSELCAVS